MSNYRYFILLQVGDNDNCATVRFLTVPVPSLDKGGARR